MFTSKKILVLLVAFFLSCNLLYAQKFANQRLEEIKTSLNAMGVDNESFSSGEFFVASLSADKPIYVHKDKRGVVDHIGFKLFNDALIDEESQVPMYFIERYFLELLMKPTDIEIDIDTKQNKVNLFSNVYTGKTRQIVKQVIKACSDETYVSVQNAHANYKMAVVAGEKQILTIDMPARYELLQGITKLEAEQQFIDKLMDYSRTAPELVLDVKESDLTQGIVDYSANDGYYLIENIRSTSYYDLDNGVVTPVYSDDNRLHSVYNIFNCTKDFGVQATVTESTYYGKLKLEISLAKLMQYLRASGCQVYTGIEEIEKGKVTGVSMAVNAALGYQHQIQFVVPSSIFEDPASAKVELKMHCYVPIHNLAVSSSIL